MVTLYTHYCGSRDFDSCQSRVLILATAAKIMRKLVGKIQISVDEVEEC